MRQQQQQQKKKKKRKEDRKIKIKKGRKQEIIICTIYLIAKSGLPRDHHALFVETHENGSSTGHIYHVKGNMKEGMNFEHRTEQLPEDIPGFYSKKKLGVVAIAEYRCVLGICEGMPVPKKQFHGARRLYQREPLKRCQEWVAEAVNALKGEGGL